MDNTYNKKNNNKNKRHQYGGRVIMPAEYYGQESGKYYAPGSPELNIPSCQRPSSFGTIFDDNTVGPILRTQYGGKKHKSYISKQSKKSKRQKILKFLNKNHTNNVKKKSLKSMHKRISKMSKRIQSRITKCK